MQFVEKTETVNMGGGSMVDIIVLKDGRVVALNDEAVVLFSSLEDFYSCEHADRPAIKL